MRRVSIQRVHPPVPLHSGKQDHKADHCRLDHPKVTTRVAAKKTAEIRCCLVRASPRQEVQQRRGAHQTSEGKGGRT